MTPVIKKFEIKIEGTSPLIMHNGMGSDPADPRELPVFLQKKTEMKTHGEAQSLKQQKNKKPELIALTSFFSSLYRNERGQIVYPAKCLKKMLVEGGKEFKVGRASLKSKVQKAVTIINDAILVFPDSEKLKDQSLFDKHRYDTMVKVNMSMVASTRAIFPKWSVTFVVELLEHVLDQSQLKDILALGEYSGSLERRPEFGRFKVKSFKKIS